MKESFFKKKFRKCSAKYDQHYTMIMDGIKSSEVRFKHLPGATTLTQFMGMLCTAVYNGILKIKIISLT